MKKIGIALGGGGARGLAHIGVLKILENSKVPVYAISGISMGAIIGAAYAIEPNIEKLEKRVREILSGSVFSKLRIEMLQSETGKNEKSTFLEKAKSFIINGYIHIVEETKPAFFMLDKLEELVYGLLPDIDISDTKLPFACVATDLTNGKEKVFTKGSIRKCVIASSCIAGVFPPLLMDGFYYNDGGYVGSIPVKVLKDLGADYIIASDVKSRSMRWEKVSKAKDVISRSNYITGALLSEYMLKEADLVISPAVKHINWTGFNKIDFLIKKGEKAMFFKIVELKTVTGYKNLIDKIINFFKYFSSSRPNK